MRALQEPSVIIVPTEDAWAALPAGNIPSRKQPRIIPFTFIIVSSFFSSLSGDLPFSCLEIISSQENVLEDLQDNEKKDENLIMNVRRAYIYFLFNGSPLNGIMKM